MRSRKQQSVSPSPLVRIGLTPDEAAGYQILLKEGAMTSQELGKAMERFPNAIYRLMTKLKDKGFVVKLESYPIKFQAIPGEVAIEALAKKRIKEVEEHQAQSLASLRNNAPAAGTGIEVLAGKKAMFEKSAEMIRRAKKEVLIISIGEEVPDEIKLANRDALARGVAMRLLVQKYDKENKGILEAWVKMGIEVRHYPGAGYHLQIVDARECLLAASNPKDSAERTAMVIKSEGLAGAMRNYFESVWEKGLTLEGKQ